jgi:hypothetical protein
MVEGSKKRKRSKTPVARRVQRRGQKQKQRQSQSNKQIVRVNVGGGGKSAAPQAPIIIGTYFFFIFGNLLLK